MGVLVKDIINLFKLQVAHSGSPQTTVEDYEVNRPGLQLTGYYDFFQPLRIQVFGKTECCYLKSMSDEKRLESIKELFKHSIPCIIIANGNEVSPELISCAEEFNIWLLYTERETSTFKVDLTIFLQQELANSIQLHGTLIDVFGVGVLITGESGIGKSETALSLIQNNHILIADDSVIVKRFRSDMLIGTGTEITNDLLEIRGIGIIDIRSLYGLKAVRADKKIDIVVHLEVWDEASSYERLGDKYETTEILGIELPYMRIPVRSGRTLASIVEVAAINFRQNLIGINTANLLEHRLITRLAQQKSE
jgi:HPr kinase/phosphorylase